MKKKSIILVFLPIIITVSVVVGILLGYFYQFDKDSSSVIYPRADKLSNIISYISKEYVDPIDKSDIIEEAIPKVIEQLDPHSQYIPAKDLQQVNEPLMGNFSGIGVQFNMLNDTLMVIKTIPNGPSEKVGILSGDRFIMVDGDTVAGVKMPSDSVVSRLKGPKGTQVTVAVLRKGVDELLYFDIKRDNIPLYSVDVAYMIDHETGYIKINKFARTTFEEFSAAASDLLGQGMQKMVLDLRGNGGGYLNAAVNIADQFLDDGQLIVYTQGHASEREDFKATSRGLCLGIDIAVLIDENSASASEILAGAIQDNDRGYVIGRRSFGKGLVQAQSMLSDGSALRLTIARYYTPTGRCIQKPYENGHQDYYSEIAQRYYHGEFLVQDSIEFADSLKYRTPGGRTVYGGGGIMPDVFVPIDTSGVSDYLIDVQNRGLIYRYALEYTDKYRKDLEQMTSLDEIENYLRGKGVFNDFIKYAETKGVSKRYQEIKVSKEILETQLHAYIVRNVLDNAGFYPILKRLDNALNVALDELKTQI